MLESTPPPHRCSTCKSAVNARNLVVFIDGTSNKPGPEETNVKKLYDRIFKGKGPECEQDKHYVKGIGAHEVDDLPLLSRWGTKISGTIEQVLARNVKENVQDAYKWLVGNYVEGAQIYLFGFSRGAYQVRALASMIHEVGLLKIESIDKIEQAYHHYLSINPNNPKTRESAIQFKEGSCSRPSVRIHFVGVWDTVSSLGLIKRVVHITASASVTNACHFRHALALNERRVKFMPEYFLEMNAHRSNVQSPRSAVSDVKEVWFVGYHSDVGGKNRPHIEHEPHAGNVSLLWMAREAIAEGLVSELEEFTWHPEDVDLGSEDSMSFGWQLLEYWPILHQVSFSGTGKHKRGWHQSRPRSIIPGQPIHFSVLPSMRQGVSGGLWRTGTWTSELLDESTTTRLLKSSLADPQKTLKFLGEVLHLLDFRLDRRQAEGIPTPKWSDWLGTSTHTQSNFEKFALTTIYDTISNSSTSDSEYLRLVGGARDALKEMLHDRSCPPKVFYIVQFSAKHEELRRRFIAHDDVIAALMSALERPAESAPENMFPLVMNSLCYLIQDGGKRDYVISQLTTPGEAGTGKTRLSLALETKVPSHLTASLRMIASVARYQKGPCEGLKPRIIELAKKGRGSTGSAAVEALVALNESQEVLHGAHFSNILGYLGNTLPRLDAEVGNVSSSSVVASPVPRENGGTSSLPPVPHANDTEVDRAPFPDSALLFFRISQVNGSSEVDKEDAIMCKLLQAIESRNVRERTAATLTLLKLCQYPIVRGSSFKKKILDTFMKQLERKETSLLAAYALNGCLKYKMWKLDDLPQVPEKIVNMVKRGWFDDAIGRVEGSEIFRGLISGDLRQEVIDRDILSTLRKRFENGKHHKVRMSLICLDIILEQEGSVDLVSCVTKSLEYLKSENRKTQKRGVKILSALAQTKAGERAIELRLTDILEMLLPSPDSPNSPVPRSRLFGATSTVYDLCKNETLREKIKVFEKFTEFQNLHPNEMLYPEKLDQKIVTYEKLRQP